MKIRNNFIDVRLCIIKKKKKNYNEYIMFYKILTKK